MDGVIGCGEGVDGCVLTCAMPMPPIAIACPRFDQFLADPFRHCLSAPKAQT